MNWLREIVAAMTFGTAFAVLLVVAEIWSRQFHGKPEWTRKLVHLGGGVVTLLFPFFLQSPWTVLVMAVTLCALFAAGQRWGFLHSLHSVNRKSRGSEYYPLSVFLAFLLARDRPWLYLAAILVLATADAFAALIGTKYGRIKYSVEDSQKSLEGSLAFLLIALLVMVVPMRLMTPLPAIVILLSAILVAVLVTAFEAISLHGRDNLFVPLAVLVVLNRITAQSLMEIEFQVLSLTVMIVGIGLLVWRTRTFNVGAALVFVLFSYGVWSLGSWQWALPALMGFLLYVLLRFACTAGHDYVQQARVKVLSRAILPPFALLAFANGTSRYDLFYGPYLAACAAILTLSLWGYWLWQRPVAGPWRLPGAAMASLAASALVALLPWALQKVDPRALGVVFAAGIIAGLLGDRLMGRNPSFEREHLWPASHFILVALAAVLVIVMQSLGWIPLWRPL